MKVFAIACLMLSFGCASQKLPQDCDRQPASVARCWNVLKADRRRDFRPFLETDFTLRLQARFDLLKKYVGINGQDGVVAVTTKSENMEYKGWTWVRDGALMTNELLRQLSGGYDLPLLEKSGGFTPPPPSADRDWIIKQFKGYMEFTRKTQDDAGLDNLGEPRFDFSGKKYQGPWGRPQNDGPALRALTLIGFSRWLILSQSPEAESLLPQLYKAEPFDKLTSLVKRDLEYVSKHLNDRSVEIWEESSGHHFYALLVQAQALMEGADLARRLKDPGAAQVYQKAAEQALSMLETFKNKDRNQIDVSHDHQEKYPKPSELDVQVILAANHTTRAYNGPRDFLVTDPWFLSTVDQIEKRSQDRFEINKKVTQDSEGHKLGPLIFRYEEDKYNGSPDEANRYTGGHPWVLATAGVGEFYFNVARQMQRDGKITVNEIDQNFFKSLLGRDLTNSVVDQSQPLFTEIRTALIEKGKTFAYRIFHHLDGDGSFSEMINGTTGNPESIPELGWSDASVYSMLTAWKNATSGEPPQLFQKRTLKNQSRHR